MWLTTIDQTSSIYNINRKTPPGRKKRSTYSPYKDKTAMEQNTWKKRHTQKRGKNKKHVLLSGRMHTVYYILYYTVSKND